MDYTKNMFFNKPDDEDKVLVKDFNENADRMDNYLQYLKTALITKADLTDPNFFGIPMAPDINNPNTSSQIATLNSMIYMLNIKDVVVYESEDKFPNPGDETKLYILHNNNNNAEYIWKQSKYVKIR